ncbi:phenylalanine--tRNA ligase subunit beta [Ferruginibacter sp. SUN106]|uniref:phenylalanine--tRNA ligase subunit beta n=1 Tax=Ferruginibacter sp. SUN106 TaxID=2978348 RepID=UPI003D369A1F
MTISYNWLSEYLPEKIEPEKLSKILTSIGLEVETMEPFEEVKGGLKGLVIGEVLECEKHPDADKLSLTKVNIGSGDPLQIVCGAPNVAAGQKVIVATIGTTIYPSTGEPLTMKKAKIRGSESHGMICAEDEIGLGQSHAGILILPADAKVGTPAAEYFNTYSDIIFEIGLTPNRMDAMSHLGVAKDVCAYLSHHNKKDTTVKSPFKNNFKVDHQGLQMEVLIENAIACQRYSGVSIQGVTIAESPKWLQQKLKSIGLRPINNIVDITNFILHETGQPLHAFDADQVIGKKVIIKNVAEGTAFVTLDDKERKLSAEDLMICNAEAPMCIGGVFGGLHSGVTAGTKNIFLESAWFNPITIRKTSFRHGLRTDAATRFEKGVDISNTVNVLKRAAIMIKEIAGGQIASDIIDVYPTPKQKTEVALKYHYLKKLSGKNYHGDTIKNILTSLGFEMIKEGMDEMWVKVPFSKPDITIAADLVEEIMRIDGLDNVEIPQMITIAPAVETLAHQTAYQEKVATYLVGLGFNEIFTNSITNSAYFTETTLQSTVKMINNLSEELNVMRPSMLETGLETIAHNLNRKNNNIRFFEFGKTYSTDGVGSYAENNHLCLFATGAKTEAGWNNKVQKADFYFVKAVVEKIAGITGLSINDFAVTANEKLNNAVEVKIKNEPVATIGEVNKKTAEQFDCKQPVFIADINWDKLMQLNKKNSISFKEISKFPAVQRDLAIVVDKSIAYQQIEKTTFAAKLNKLKNVSLFDVFESEKLGANKKSMAVSFTFLDEEKTMTDSEIDAMMNKIIGAYEKELNAEIRK